MKYIAYVTQERRDATVIYYHGEAPRRDQSHEKRVGFFRVTDIEKPVLYDTAADAERASEKEFNRDLGDIKHGAMPLDEFLIVKMADEVSGVEEWL